MDFTEYEPKPNEDMKSILHGRFHFAVMDLVEDMREKGVEEQEIDECLFDELQSILNEGRKGED